MNATPWKISDTSTPRSISSARAASTSSTASSRLPTDPGTAVVTPVPKMSDASEPGGVNCRTLKSSVKTKSASSRQPSDAKNCLVRSASDTGRITTSSFMLLDRVSGTWAAGVSSVVFMVSSVGVGV